MRESVYLDSLTAIGHIGHDEIDQEGKLTRNAGGALLHFAAGFAAVGRPLRIKSITLTGDPLISASLRELEWAGVDTSGIQNGPISTFRLRYSNAGDAAEVTVGAPSLAGVISEVAPRMRSRINLHICPLPQPDFALAVGSLPDDSRITMQTHLSLVEQLITELEKHLPRIHRIFLSDEEASFVRRKLNSDLQGLAKRMAPGALLVVTRPDLVRCVGSSLEFSLQIDTVSDSEIVDRTGAGDVFAGSFLAGESMGLKLASCARIAAAYAALKLSGYSSSSLFEYLRARRLGENSS